MESDKKHPPYKWDSEIIWSPGLSAAMVERHAGGAGVGSDYFRRRYVDPRTAFDMEPWGIGVSLEDE